MKTGLNEEIKMIKLLSGYSTKKTLNENLNILLEDGKTEAAADFKNIISNLRTIDNDLERFVKTYKVEVNGQKLLTAAELRADINSLSSEQLKQLKTFLINTSLNVALVDSLILNMVKSQGFKDVYSQLSKEEALVRLAQKGYTKDKSERILSEYKRMGGEFKSFVIPKSDITKLTLSLQTEFPELFNKKWFGGLKYDDAIQTVINNVENEVKSKKFGSLQDLESEIRKKLNLAESNISKLPKDEQNAVLSMLKKISPLKFDIQGDINYGKTSFNIIGLYALGHLIYNWVVNGSPLYGIVGQAGKELKGAFTGGSEGGGKKVNWSGYQEKE